MFHYNGGSEHVVADAASGHVEGHNDGSVDEAQETPRT